MKRWCLHVVLSLSALTCAQAFADALQDAKDALLDGDYAQGVTRYQQILAAPDRSTHAEALEYLGVAYERLGEPAKAQSSYRAYLAQFGSAPGAGRVQQRLDVLLAATAEIGDTPPIPRRPDQGPWSFRGGVSQDFWMDSFEMDGVEDTDSRSNLITFVNLDARRSGERFDLQSRVDAGYRNELRRSSPSSTSKDSEVLVSNAFVAVADQQLGVGASLGRQSLYGDGVLGRFDGLRATYAWREHIRFNTTLGLAVDSPRYQGDSRRPFAGISAHIDQVLDQFDVQLFAIARTNESQSDREAVGTQIRWRRDRWQVVGNVDFDLSYQTLNSAFLHANYAWSDRLQLYARANSYAQPFLTTTNSVIGQPTTSLDTLEDLNGYTESQIRTLARNRTSEAWTATGGFTYNLSQRWYANGNVTYSDFGGSVASGGIAAAPDTQQFYSSIDLIGSSIFRNSDTTIFGYRLQSTSTADTNTLRFELRLPMGDKLRVGPMLSASYRDAVTGDQQLIIEPGLRATYRWGERYRLELEGRGRWSNRKLPSGLLGSPLYPDEEEQSEAYFFQLGWRVDL